MASRGRFHKRLEDLEGQSDGYDVVCGRKLAVDDAA